MSINGLLSTCFNLLCLSVQLLCLWKWKWKWSHSVFVTPWTVAYQAPPSIGFSRQEYWSGLPFPSPLNGHEFEQTPGDGQRQGSLACCSSWGHRVGHDWVTGQHQTCPLESVMPSDHLILCCPLSSCPRSFPAPGSFSMGCPGGSEVKASASNAGDPGSIPGSGRSPREGNGNPLQYSCLENPMDWGAWGL